MRRTTKMVCALALLGSMTAQSADRTSASDSGFEVGIGMGQGELRLKASGIPGSATLDSAAFKGFIGYRFCRYFSLEGAYVDGGSFSQTVSDVNFSPPQNASFSTHSHIETASALGILPLNEYFSLFARAGVAHWESTLTLSDPLGRAESRVNHNPFVWGGGGLLSFEGAQIRLEYEQLKTNENIAGILPVDIRYRLISMSVAWLF